MGRLRSGKVSLQGCWAGTVLELAFGIGAATTSLSKILRDCGKSWSIPHWSMLLVWYCVNFIRIAVLTRTQSCSISVFIQLNLGLKITKIRKVVCSRLGFYYTNTPAVRLLFCEIFFFLFSALSIRIRCSGSKTGLVTEHSKSYFQIFLTQSRDTSMKREGKRRPRLIFLFCFSGGSILIRTPAHADTRTETHTGSCNLPSMRLT